MIPLPCARFYTLADETREGGCGLLNLGAVVVGLLGSAVGLTLFLAFSGDDTFSVRRATVRLKQ